MLSRYDIGVFYLGKYTNLIGPPKSMSDLAELLESRFRVKRCKNIEPQKSHNNFNTKSTKVPKKNRFMANIIKFLKSNQFTYDLYILYILIAFNLQVLFFYFFNPNAKIIITQPFLILNFFSCIRSNVVYIRRANSCFGVRELSARKSYAKKAFDKVFFKYGVSDLVYLVPQSNNLSAYKVIPNHFHAEWLPKYFDRDIIKVFYVGTWCSRKGGDYFLKIFKKAIDGVTAEVFGGLGSDIILNNELLNSKIISYRGVVDKPYSLMACGDIFMSTSRIEGLQRSLVESMLSGCLVLAFERPDSLFLSESPGVFLCTEDSVVTILEKITALDVSDRLQLGRLNRQYAINHFSCDVVLDKWSELLNG